MSRVKSSCLTAPIAAVLAAVIFRVMVTEAPGEIDAVYVPATTAPVMSVDPFLKSIVNPGDLPCPLSAIWSGSAPSFWTCQEKEALDPGRTGTPVIDSTGARRVVHPVADEGRASLGQRPVGPIGGRRAR